MVSRGDKALAADFLLALCLLLSGLLPKILQIFRSLIASSWRKRIRESGADSARERAVGTFLPQLRPCLGATCSILWGRWD